MVSPKGPVTSGVDFNYWQRLDSITQTSFNTAADAIFAFKGGTRDIILTVEGSTTVLYSFNGSTVHGELIPSSDRSQLIFHRRPVTKIWFKVATGTGAVTIEAWAAT